MKNSPAIAPKALLAFAAAAVGCWGCGPGEGAADADWHAAR